ncbi:MAG: PDZ domain-containing protein, partial [Glaciecola sp.]
AGDIITKINGNDLTGFNELRAKVGSLVAGTKVTLTIVRNGEVKEIDVTLGSAGVTQVEAKDLHPALEGAELENGVDRQNRPAVVVSEVTERSPSARIGLQEGDVIIGANRNRVSNVADLSRIAEASKDVIALTVQRGNSQIIIVIR